MATGTIKNSYAVKNLEYTVTPESGISIRGFAMREMGKLAFGSLYFDVTSAISSGGDIATLNRDLPQPIGGYAVASVCNSVGTPGMVYIVRGTSNKIKAWSSLPVGNYYYAQFIYAIL